MLASVNGTAPIIVGSIRDFFCLVRKENPDVTTHCFLHREVLVSKSLEDKMKKVLDHVKKLVLFNFIKQDQFTQEYSKTENLDKEDISLLLHIEI